MNQLILNSYKCLLCGDTLVSKHRHDYVCCTCGNLSIDGGNSYQRISYKDLTAIEDNSVYWNGNNFKEVREVFTWRTYGKNSEYKEPKYIKLKDMQKDHIEAILSTQWHITGTFVEKLFKLELEYRKENN